MIFQGKHIISASQFSRQSLEQLFSWAHRMRSIANREVECHVLAKYTLGTFFWEESTRTRLSSERAFILLGGHVSTMTDMKFSSMVKGESLKDSARVLSRLCDIMVVRCKKQGEARKIAQYSKVPVINGGDGKGEHPTQALLDLFTISEKRKSKIDGLKIVMVGDLRHSRTVHSLVKILTLYRDIKFVFVAPVPFQVPVVLERLIRKRGHSCEKKENVRVALKGADAIYMVRPQLERMNVKNKKIISSHRIFQLTGALVKRYCKKSVIIMHPLPRNSELAEDVDDLPQAAYFDAIDYGVLIRMALFLLVLGKQEKFC